MKMESFIIGDAWALRAPTHKTVHDHTQAGSLRCYPSVELGAQVWWQIRVANRVMLEWRHNNNITWSSWFANIKETIKGMSVLI